MMTKTEKLLRECRKELRQFGFTEDSHIILRIDAALAAGWEPVAYARDLDGTGSLHMCSRGDKGAIALYAAPKEPK